MPAPRGVMISSSPSPEVDELLLFKEEAAAAADAEAITTQTALFKLLIRKKLLINCRKKSGTFKLRTLIHEVIVIAAKIQGIQHITNGFRRRGGRGGAAAVQSSHASSPSKASSVHRF